MKAIGYCLLLLLLISGCKIVYINADGARVGWIEHESITTNDVTFTTETTHGLHVSWW